MGEGVRPEIMLFRKAKNKNNKETTNKQFYVYFISKYFFNFMDQIDCPKIVYTQFKNVFVNL